MAYKVLNMREENIRRIRWVEELMCSKPMRKGKLIARIKKKYGIQFRQAEDYIAAAREQIMLKIRDTKDMLRADSIAVYKAIVNSPTSSCLEKTRAQERIDKLLGLEQPMQIQVEATTKQNVLPLEALDLDTRRRLLKQLREGAVAPVVEHSRTIEV